MQKIRPRKSALASRMDALLRGRTGLVGLPGPLKTDPHDHGSLTREECERLATALLRLQRGLTGVRALAGARYMDDPDMLAAYLFYYWPVSYSQVSCILARAGFRSGRWIGRVLDMGAGPGPASAALLDAGAESAVLVEKSPAALELARRAIPLGGTDPGRLSFLSADLEGESPWACVRGTHPFDWVVFVHSLNELWKGVPNRDARVLALVRDAASVLSPRGILLVVEPAPPATCRPALALRDGLAAEGWSILAPCPGRSHLPCPALAAGPGQSCHDELLWDAPGVVLDLALRAGLDKESIKAAWFLARPPTAPPPSSAYPEDVLRVVSDPLLNKAGRIRYLLCGSRGRFPFSATAEYPRTPTSGLPLLRRGDIIRVLDPEVRVSGWGMGSNTRVEILP